MQTRVAGIPCQIRVLLYSKGTHRMINSASLEPNDPPEFEFRVLDTRGRPAPWLEQKLTLTDETRLMREYEEYLDAFNEP